jgi:2-haloacid dehalogenase
LKLGFLSNLTPRMLRLSVEAGNLRDLFDQLISADMVRSYKPDHRAYELGINSFQMDRQEILFVAYAAWDAAGAKKFGYPTFWLNRSRSQEEPFGVEPDATGSTLADLLRFVDAS